MYKYFCVVKQKVAIWQKEEHKKQRDWMKMKKRKNTRSDSLSVVCRHIFDISSAKGETRKQLNQTSLWTVFFSLVLFRRTQRKRIVFVYHWKWCKKDANAMQRKSSRLLLFVRKKNLKITELRMQRCNTDSNTCADYITQLMLLSCLLKQSLIELCSEITWKSSVFFF